jgi:hypothetical protein
MKIKRKKKEIRKGTGRDENDCGKKNSYKEENDRCLTFTRPPGVCLDSN